MRYNRGVTSQHRANLSPDGQPLGELAREVPEVNPAHNHGVQGHGSVAHQLGEHGEGKVDHGHEEHGHGGHGHGHGGHGHGVVDLSGVQSRRAFVIATALNLAFVAIEFTYGVVAGSTALVADASHNLGDVLGLLLAWGAAWLHQRRPSKTMTYGFRKSTVLASLANALLLVFTVGAVMWESVGRFANPQPVSGSIMMAVAAVGVAVNAGSAVLFMRGAKSDLNLRGAYLHLVADASVSLAVVVAGLVVILKPDWLWVDPVTSIAVSLLVLWSTWQLLRQALLLTLDGVPGHLDTESVKQTLLGIPGVVEVADLHVWALSTSESALTAHLVVAEGAPKGVANVAGEKVRELYGIEHSTIQIDAAGQACAHC